MVLPLTAAELYLDLLKKCLTRYLFGSLSQMVQEQPFDYEQLRARTLQIEDGHRRVRVTPSAPDMRLNGQDWPARRRDDDRPEAPGQHSDCASTTSCAEACRAT